MVKYNSQYYSTSTSNPYFYCWIVALIISSCYTYTWDVKVDWGLFSSDSPKETPFLREEIVYSSPLYYYFAIIQDLVLRFGWTLSISLTELGYANSDLMLSILAPLEIYRFELLLLLNYFGNWVALRTKLFGDWIASVTVLDNPPYQIATLVTPVS